MLLRVAWPAVPTAGSSCWLTSEGKHWVGDMCLAFQTLFTSGLFLLAGLGVTCSQTQPGDLEYPLGKNKARLDPCLSET